MFPVFVVVVSTTVCCGCGCFSRSHLIIIILNHDTTKLLVEKESNVDDVIKHLYANPQSTHRGASAGFWRTFHHDRKIIVTITYKFVVCAPAEWADTLTLFHLYQYMYSVRKSSGEKTAVRWGNVLSPNLVAIV